MAGQRKVECVEQMKVRTKQIGLTAINIFRRTKKTDEGRIVGKQFLMSAL